MWLKEDYMAVLDIPVLYKMFGGTWKNPTVIP